VDEKTLTNGKVVELHPVAKPTDMERAEFRRLLRERQKQKRAENPGAKLAAQRAEARRMAREEKAREQMRLMAEEEARRAKAAREEFVRKFKERPREEQVQMAHTAVYGAVQNFIDVCNEAEELAGVHVQLYADRTGIYVVDHDIAREVGTDLLKVPLGEGGACLVPLLVGEGREPVEHQGSGLVAPDGTPVRALTVAPEGAGAEG